MSMPDLLPTMSDTDLQTLKANAERLQTAGVPAQQRAAADLLPLIEAEIAGRPGKPAKAAKVAKAAKPAKPATKAKAKAKAA